jgi:hypothetical protein
MIHYRLYCEDADGHIRLCHERMLSDDAAALEEARGLDYPHVVSVWQQARKVGDVRPEAASRAA